MHADHHLACHSGSRATLFQGAAARWLPVAALQEIGEALATPATSEGNVVELSSSLFKFHHSIKFLCRSQASTRSEQTNTESLQLICCGQPGASAGNRSQSLQLSEKFQAAYLYPSSNCRHPHPDIGYCSSHLRTGIQVNKKRKDEEEEEDDDDDHNDNTTSP